jgi:drug/metabolite transporter (DMT)-like permease
MKDKSLPYATRPRLIDNVPLVVIFLLLADSLHFVFARLMLPYLPPATSAMYVLAIATVQLAVFTLIWGNARLSIFRRYVWFFLAVGFLVGASTAMNYASVAFVDPGTAALLGKTSVLFGLAFGLIWLKERFTAIETVGAVIAIIGTIVIAFQPGDYFRLGALLVLISTFMYALHAALVKRYSTDMGLAEFFFFRLLCTTGFLFLFVVGRGQLQWPVWQGWVILILAGTIDVVLSRGLYYIALRKLKLTHHSLVLTLGPLITILWTFLLFGVVPTAQQMVGGVAVLAGVLMVTVGRDRATREI